MYTRISQILAVLTTATIHSLTIKNLKLPTGKIPISPFPSYYCFQIAHMYPLRSDPGKTQARKQANNIYRHKLLEKLQPFLPLLLSPNSPLLMYPVTQATQDRASQAGNSGYTYWIVHEIPQEIISKHKSLEKSPYLLPRPENKLIMFPNINY